MTELNLLSAGAAMGLVRALDERIRNEVGVTLTARFDAVGAIEQAFDAGAPCDVLVLTAPMLARLDAAGALAPHSIRPIGLVRTGVAVRAGMPHPDLSTPEALAAALGTADALYGPDTVRSTAGIHLMKVLRELGLADPMRERLHEFPNGATAMRELAAARSAQPLGCTQVTEILYTPGVELVAPLPARFELATLYSAAVSARAADRVAAERLVDLICGDAAQALRRTGGFDT